MSECETCGREDGHYIGCAAVAKPQVGDPDLRNEGPDSEDQCAREGCTNPRAPQGKGPRPKYCEEHKTGSK